MNMTQAGINPNCRMCGQPISDSTHIIWNGNHYHNDHLPKQEPPQGWQSIDSAPKQYQKKMLLWFPWESGGAIFLGCWFEPDDDKPDGWYDPYDWEMIGTDASHWMPLPEPPNSRT